MKEELRHELVRLIYSPEIVSFELTREQGLEILKEIERLNKESEQLRTALNSKESIIKEAREFIEKFNKVIRENKMLGEYANFMTIPKEPLEILDKEKE